MYSLILCRSALGLKLQLSALELIPISNDLPFEVTGL